MPSRSRIFMLVVSLGTLATVHADTPKPKKEAENPALQAAAAFYDGIQLEVLPNGLQVYLKPIPGAATVSTMVAYKVGSADEELSATGLSHYLEHLMFKGTNKILPGDIDRLTQRNGGANNASTSEDMTVYYFDFAADRWESALAVEADRMRNLQIDTRHEFEQEKGAVIEELQRDEDEPWDLERKEILPILFGKENPYGHPVIGEREHVRGATAAVIKGHYDRWYHPNNAVLVIAGGFDPEKTLAKVKELFGPIPSARLPVRKIIKAAKRTGPERRLMGSKFDVPRLLFGWNTVPSDHPDYPALNVLEGILSAGKTSRLYKHLIEGAEIASAADASNMGGRYPGWFAVQIELLKGKDARKAEKLVIEEMQRLGEEPVTPAELQRVQRGILASTVFARESVHGLAESIARGVTVNDLDYLKQSLPRILAVTAADVQRVARTYLPAHKRVLIDSVPSNRREGGNEGEGKEKEKPAPRRQAARAGAAAADHETLARAKRVELPNGLVLLLLEDRRLPMVTAQVLVKHVTMLEPEAQPGVAALTGALLDEGTATHTGEAIAELIENVGGELSLTTSGGSVRVLSPDRHLGLSLLLDCLTHPTFPEAALERKRQQILSQLADEETRPDARAQRGFLKAVYGKHPFGRPPLGTPASVAKLKQVDCKTFHQAAVLPNNALLAVVGDFKTDELIEEIKDLTKSWEKGKLATPQVTLPEKPAGFVQQIITMPRAAQLHFFMGHLGVRRNDPDYYKLLVMDNVLGTGPGFTDRLSARLRDREGLAYTVRANITSGAADEPGAFVCYIGTEASNFERVKAEFLEELNRIRTTEPTADEVEDAKRYLLGSLPFQVATSSGVAGQLLAIERFGLGLDYLTKYRAAVSAVTPADIQAVARKHVDPEHMVLVAAGAIGKDGKPLNKIGLPKP